MTYALPLNIFALGNLTSLLPNFDKPIARKNVQRVLPKPVAQLSAPATAQRVLPKPVPKNIAPKILKDVAPNNVQRTVLKPVTKNAAVKKVGTEKLQRTQIKAVPQKFIKWPIPENVKNEIGCRTLFRLVIQPAVQPAPLVVAPTSPVPKVYDFDVLQNEFLGLPNIKPLVARVRRPAPVKLRTSVPVSVSKPLAPYAEYVLVSLSLLPGALIGSVLAKAVVHLMGTGEVSIDVAAGAAVGACLAMIGYMTANTNEKWALMDLRKASFQGAIVGVLGSVLGIYYASLV